MNSFENIGREYYLLYENLEDTSFLDFYNSYLYDKPIQVKLSCLHQYMEFVWSLFANHRYSKSFIHTSIEPYLTNIIDVYSMILLKNKPDDIELLYDIILSYIETILSEEPINSYDLYGDIMNLDNGISEGLSITVTENGYVLYNEYTKNATTYTTSNNLYIIRTLIILHLYKFFGLISHKSEVPIYE